MVRFVPLCRITPHSGLQTVSGFSRVNLPDDREILTFLNICDTTEK
jgi:hypothetical protein